MKNFNRKTLALTVFVLLFSVMAAVNSVFALFSFKASNDNNSIKAGNIVMAFKVSDFEDMRDAKDLKAVNPALFHAGEAENLAPGAIITKYISVENHSAIDIEYLIKISGKAGAEGNLLPALAFEFKKVSGTGSAVIKTAKGEELNAQAQFKNDNMAAKSDNVTAIDVYKLVISFPIAADNNDYQNMETLIDLTLDAVQKNNP